MLVLVGLTVRHPCFPKSPAFASWASVGVSSPGACGNHGKHADRTRVARLPDLALTQARGGNSRVIGTTGEERGGSL
jgi:hypothetical protein